MTVRIEASNLPGRTCSPSAEAPGGYRDVRVGVQRRRRPDDLLGLVPGSAPAATWVLACTARSTAVGIDVSGPHIQGPAGALFIYLSWVSADGTGGARLFRRAKLHLDGVPAEVLDQAAVSGLLVGRLGLTDRRGHQLCAAVRPPLIAWSAAAAGQG